MNDALQQHINPLLGGFDDVDEKDKLEQVPNQMSDQDDRRATSEDEPRVQALPDLDTEYGKQQARPTLHIYLTDEGAYLGPPPEIYDALVADANAVEGSVMDPDREQGTPITPVPVEEEVQAVVESESAREDPITESRPAQNTPNRRHQSRCKLLPLILCCVMVVGTLAGIAAAVITLAGTPTAMITIVPHAKQITTSSTITLVTGIADATHRQVQGRALPSVVMSLAETIKTTGIAYQDAKAARGTVTFYNGAPYEQTITTGTLLTGGDGVQVVTDEDAILPSVSYPTLGQATVTAHAAITGPRGNIQPGDIYGLCCRLNVSAINGAFRGGQDARTYRTVTVQDINAVATLLKTSLDKSVQAALQAQVQGDETLIMLPTCQSTTKLDHQPGEEAAQVSVTVSETCNGHTYNMQAYQATIAQMLQTEASKKLGDRYMLAGMIQSSITKAIPKDHDQIELQVSIIGNYTYQFDPEQQQHMKALVAGTTKAEATNALLHEPGVQSVSIKSDAETLPTDIKHIQVSFLMTGWSES
ncbi:MAG TPA: hypothetical protein VKR06_03390 [Ktedonosporobacter sp.]|nr:hypothetical protein [Ktedonosporobacter sp.]